MKQWVLVAGVFAVLLAPRTAAGTIGRVAERLGAPICVDPQRSARPGGDPVLCPATRSAPSPYVAVAVAIAPIAPIAPTPGQPMFDAPGCAAEPPLACTGATLQSPDRLDRGNVPGPDASIDPGAFKAVRAVENPIAFTDTFVRWVALLFLAVITGVPLACASIATGTVELGESPARAPPNRPRSGPRGRPVGSGLMTAPGSAAGGP